jgi:hypothetical protein
MVELTGILVHAGYGLSQRFATVLLTLLCVDVISSKTSVAPFDNKEIQDHLKYLKHLRGTVCILIPVSVFGT